MGSERSGEAAILELLSARAPGKTICPSEAARTLAGDGDFRPHMDEVHAAARRLIARGQIEALQRGEQIDLETARGPVRLRATGSHDATTPRADA